MRLVLSTMLAVVALAAGGLLATETASAQDCQNGSFTKRMVWDQDHNSWVVREFFCSGGSYHPTGGILHNFNSVDKPEGWIPTQNFRSDGFPVIHSAGEDPPPVSANSYWDPEYSRAINRLASQYVDSHNSTCGQLNMRWTRYPDGRQAGILYGYPGGAEIDPEHVYRVGDDWVYIPNAADRDAYESGSMVRSGQRMSSLWGYRTVFVDHDSNPNTPRQARRITVASNCATE